jgi:SAM-dependent methyltransferase
MTGSAPPAVAIRPPVRIGPPTTGDAEADRLAAQLRARGVPVIDWFVDRSDMASYMASAGYTTSYADYYPGNRMEKALEHYVASRLLSLSSGQRYLDVASEGSAAPFIYEALYGVESWRQDLAYPSGLHGRTIGSDAGDMPLPAEFVDRIGLHCSFEHFEGDADLRFVSEAERVLRPGGALCIVPLYFAEPYSVMTDPAVAAAQQVPFEADALVCCVSGYGNRHGRFYDVEHLLDRVLYRCRQLAPTVYRLRGTEKVDASCYARVALVLRKPWRP